MSCGGKPSQHASPPQKAIRLPTFTATIPLLVCNRYVGCGLALICSQWAKPFSFPQLSSGIQTLTQLLGQSRGETKTGGADVRTIAGATGASPSSGAGGAMVNGSRTTTVANGTGACEAASPPAIPKTSRAGIKTFRTLRTAGILLSRTFDTSPLSASLVPARPRDKTGSAAVSAGPAAAWPNRRTYASQPDALLPAWPLRLGLRPESRSEPERGARPSRSHPSASRRRNPTAVWFSLSR